MKYLLDTNVCVDLLRSRPSVVERVSSVMPGDCAVSAVTAYELRSGALGSRQPARELRKIELMLRTIQELVFDRVASTESAKVRVATQKKGKPIGPYDVLIAGHALATGLILVTNNTREFARVPELQYEDWRDD
jgi:tRNA(fMet)-specific endonuclease VapC